MSSTESLGVYWGGFLYNSCSPLEITLNRCSHSCVYCFANLNKPKRKAEVYQALKLLSEFNQTNIKGQWKRTSYAANLLRQGYAVTISNRIDPLASSNWFQAKPLMQVAVEQNVMLNIQTRFNTPDIVAELFDIIKDRPVPFYVSIPTLDGEIASRCEPGAPLPEKRLEYIQQAVALGHAVNVGINPLIPGWIKDPMEHATALKQAGVTGVWLNDLHLSKRQVEQMSERDKAAFGEGVEIGLNAAKLPEMAELNAAVRQACESVGLHVYENDQAQPSLYFENIKRLSGKAFPVMQDWVNHCHANYKDGQLLYWKDFRDFFVPRLPKGKWGLRDHINSVANRQSLYGKHIPQRMNYEQLLWHCWRHAETLFCPANVYCFTWLGDRVQGKRSQWVRIVDDDDNPILMFKPNGTDGSLYTEEHGL